MVAEFPDCFKGGGASAQKGGGVVKISSWYDRMLWLAEDRPSEVEYIEKMNVYKFMQLLNGKMSRFR